MEDLISHSKNLRFCSPGLPLPLLQPGQAVRGLCQQGRSRYHHQLPFCTPHANAHTAPTFAGVFCPARPEIYEGLPGANWLKSSGLPVPAGKAWLWLLVSRRTERTKPPVPLISDIRRPQSNSLGSWVLFVYGREGGRRQPERTVLN